MAVEEVPNNMAVDPSTLENREASPGEHAERIGPPRPEITHDPAADIDPPNAEPIEDDEPPT